MVGAQACGLVDNAFDQAFLRHFEDLIPVHLVDLVLLFIDQSFVSFERSNSSQEFQTWILFKRCEAFLNGVKLGSFSEFKLNLSRFTGRPDFLDVVLSDICKLIIFGE